MQRTCLLVFLAAIGLILFTAQADQPSRSLRGHHAHIKTDDKDSRSKQLDDVITSSSKEADQVGAASQPRSLAQSVALTDSGATEETLHMMEMPEGMHATQGQAATMPRAVANDSSDSNTGMALLDVASELATPEAARDKAILREIWAGPLATFRKSSQAHKNVEGCRSARTHFEEGVVAIVASAQKQLGDEAKESVQAKKEKLFAACMAQVFSYKLKTRVGVQKAKEAVKQAANRASPTFSLEDY